MNSKVTQLPLPPRPVRGAPEPLGLYIRAGRNDHSVILNLLATGDTGCFGVVFDPTKAKVHQELKDQVLAHRLDAILDTKAMQLACPGGHTPALGALPWGEADRLQTYADFEGLAGRRLIAGIAEYAIENKYTEVLAPTHLLRSADDPWLQIDIESTRLLREQLDRNGGAAVPLIYPLALTYRMLRTPEMRALVINALEGVRVDAIWLRVDGFGVHATATAVRSYIRGATDFHVLGRKIVADCVGGKAALALLAFGAVGGIAHGVTFFEEFNSSSLRSTKKGTPFSSQRRIYVPAIDAMLTGKEAEMLIEASPQTKAAFGCRNTGCCARGIKDMHANPGRHYLYQRMGEVAGLSQLPQLIRPQRYLDLHLRQASDKAVQAASLPFGDEAFTKKMQVNRKRLDSLRVALGSHIQQSPPESFALVPETRAVRERSRLGRV